MYDIPIKSVVSMGSSNLGDAVHNPAHAQHDAAVELLVCLAVCHSVVPVSKSNVSIKPHLSSDGDAPAGLIDSSSKPGHDHDDSSDEESEVVQWDTDHDATSGAKQAAKNDKPDDTGMIDSLRKSVGDLNELEFSYQVS